MRHLHSDSRRHQDRRGGEISHEESLRHQLPAPENQQRDSSLPLAAALLAAPKAASEIARLTREAYQKHGGARVAGELLSVDRRAFLGSVFSAGAMVLGANLLADQASAATAWQPSVYLGFEPDGQIVITAHRSEMGTGSRTSL